MTSLSLTPYLFLFILWFGIVMRISSKNESRLKVAAVGGATFIFFYTLVLWIWFNPYAGIGMFQNIESFALTKHYNLLFGYDSVALIFITLTTFLFPLCLMMSWSASLKSLKYYIVTFIFLEFLLICVFLSLDFFFFYICFECALIPMFLLIGIWGSKERKSKAALYLFLYTFSGSLILLLVLIYILQNYGSTNYCYLTSIEFIKSVQLLLWPGVFLAFAVKIPMVPFHIWLPEAHVEAPTAGSVLLAGIVLKLGGFGMVRYLIPLFPSATAHYSSFVMVFSLMGAIYAAILALRQTDMKRIVAYSSIAHMNFSLLGLFSFTEEGVSGFLFMMLGHGFISSALFFLVGVLYDRHHSREHSYYSGLTERMPLFSVFFFFFTVANVGFPGTINFASEWLILLSLSFANSVVLLFGGLSLLISSFYAFWLFNRLSFGTPNIKNLPYFYDLTRLEFILFLALLFPVVVGGLFPEYILFFFTGTFSL